ncbi:MAG: 2-C-methyl-D-erythritol 4-phosphate cytidylyltransferase [Clostridia bacterium]|nr:2-C-methyl-D-erythritol 4-phosphate cytidylyltransferase [Clostridia bacterium]
MSGKKVCAVIAAAGSGSRMGGVSKPNIKILGRTLFEYVLSAIEDSFIDEIVVVCSKDNEESLKELAKSFNKPIKFVLGGSMRAESIKNGVLASSEDIEIICAHDCARPFVTREILEDTVNRAIETGASCVCSSVTDTVKYKNPQTNEVTTLDRSNMFAVQTPQCFNKRLYLDAVEHASDIYGNFTDETSLIEYFGAKVDYIVRTEPNMKLTSPSDVALAEAIFKQINVQGD